MKHAFPGHAVAHVTEMRWAGTKNGALLAKAEGMFDIFITVDKSIQHQNNFTSRQIILVTLIVKHNKLEFLLPLIPKALQALQTASPGQVINVT